MNGTSWLVGAHLFQNVEVETPDFQHFVIANNKAQKNKFGFSLDYLGYAGACKDKDYWFWESRTRPNIPESWKLEVVGFSHNDIEQLLVQMKQNNSTELSDYSFNTINHITNKQMANNALTNLPQFSNDFRTSSQVR